MDVVDAGNVVGALDRDMVLKVAEAAIGWPLAEVAVTECRAIYRPRVAATRGVYHVAGDGLVAAATATGAPERRAWEAVLKVLAPAADGSLPFEASLHASGVLSSLPRPLGNGGTCCSTSSQHVPTPSRTATRSATTSSRGMCLAAQAAEDPARRRSRSNGPTCAGRR